MIIKNTKLFNPYEYPYKITNNEYSLRQIIKDAPVVKDNVCIGYIEKVRCNGKKVYFGDVFIHPKYANLNYYVTSLEITFDKVDNTSIYIKNIIFHVEITEQKEKENED